METTSASLVIAVVLGALSFIPQVICCFPGLRILPAARLPYSISAK
jgi:hypothetical protein